MVKSTFENLAQEKKARVTQALLTEFSNHSLADAQVARIVKDADIARGAFYKYFDDLTDSYKYLYSVAMRDIHLNLRPSMEFDSEQFYQMVIDFMDKTKNSKYFGLIKLQITKNEALLSSDPNKSYPVIDSPAIWSAMVLSHETIKLLMLYPDKKDRILNRFKQSLEIIGKGMS